MKSRSFFQASQSFGEKSERTFNEPEEIDVEKTAEALVKCANNRAQFQTYIKKINSIILGEDNLNVVYGGELKRNESFELNNNFYRTDRSSGSQYQSRTSISPRAMPSASSSKGFQKSPNAKKFVLDDNQEQSFSNTNNFNKASSLTSSKPTLKTSMASSNLRYNDVNANSKYYYPVDTNSAYDSDLSSEPAQWNDRSNRNNLFERKKSPQLDESRGRKNIPRFQPAASSGLSPNQLY